jgi:hypothetical protein
MTFSSDTITTIILTSAVLAGVRLYMNLTRDKKGTIATRLLFSLIGVAIGGATAAIATFVLVFAPALMVLLVVAVAIFLYWSKGKEAAETH